MKCRFCGAVISPAEHFCGPCGRENLIFLNNQTVPLSFTYDTKSHWYYFAEIIEDALGEPILRIAYYDANTDTSGTEFQEGTQWTSFADYSAPPPSFSPALDGVAPKTYLFDRNNGWYYRFFVEKNPISNTVIQKVSYFNPITGIFTVDDGAVPQETSFTRYSGETGFSVKPTKQEQKLRKSNRALKVWIWILAILLIGVLVFLGFLFWKNQWLPDFSGGWSDLPLGLSDFLQ